MAVFVSVQVRMFQRNISTDKLVEVVNNSCIIEHYPDDKPCPSALILGFVNNKACHIVVAECVDHFRRVTIYFPVKDK
jgi:hypothetical protein